MKKPTAAARGPVPLLDLRAHHKPYRQEILESVSRVFDSGQYILGPDVAALEEEIAAYCGARFAVGLSSGTDALLACLMALDIRPGDEVVLPAYSFFATAGTVARLGAVPIFTDIDPATCNIDPGLAATKISSRTRAIMPVHLYGQCADMEPLLKLSKTRGIPLIEDAAQALGSCYRGGRRAGSMGLAGCFSFFPTKNLGGLGDGGMATTNDPDFAAKLRLLRVHGAQPKYHHAVVGGNFRLDSIQAAVLRVKLRYLDRWTDARRKNARRYHELFAASGLPAKETVRLPAEVFGQDLNRGHIYNQYVIRAQRRDQLRGFLSRLNIATEIYYPIPLHLQECFRSLGHKKGDLPQSELAAQETLALPIYPELAEDQQAAVVEAIARFYS